TPEITTLEGIATLGAYSRSAISGWTVFIGIPRQSLEAALMHSMVLHGLGIALIFCVSIGLAWFVGGRITRSARAIVASAAALGAGEQVAVPLVYLREADDIARAMASASHLLKERMSAIEAAHAASLRHEADMTQVQRIAQIGGWHWDAKMDTTLASPELCRIFGRTDFPPVMQQCDVLFPHAAWRELNHAIEEVVHSGKGYDLELPALRADGSHFWINIRAEVVRGAGGEVTGMRGMVQDITQRKQAESIAKSERFIKAIANAVPGMVSYWDSTLRCRFANRSYLEWYGKRPEDIIGGTMLDLMGEPMFALNEAYFAAVLAGEKQEFERTLTKPDGSVGHALAHYMPDIDAYGEVVGFFALVSDVTPLKKAEGELRLAANVVQNTVDGIMVTDAHRIILSVNPAFSAVTGYSARESLGQTPALLESHRHDAQFHASVWRQIVQAGQWEGEIWNRRKDGEMFLAWQTTTRIAGSAGEAARYVSVFRDITATWSNNERIKHLAFHDALTDLPNRALLMERLEHHIVLAARAPRTLAVLFLDLDQFKSINDRLGHHVGDDVLIVVARKLQALLRQSDTVARLGGDEFVILLDSPRGRDDVVDIAERIIASIHEPMTLRGETARVGTSMGIALFPADGASAAQLINQADSAMYASKKAGKNTYRFFLFDATADAQQVGVDV
ncbi:MAG: diguanylate cyclase, partial [Massilia sp.]|nr:diguanylate cyclase [Massilia sp.]